MGARALETDSKLISKYTLYKFGSFNECFLNTSTLNLGMHSHQYKQWQ